MAISACNPPRTLPEYYVQFYVSGDRYLFTKGFTDIEPVPYAQGFPALWSDYMACLIDVTFAGQGDPNNKYLWIIVEDGMGSSIGTWLTGFGTVAYWDGQVLYDTIGAGTDLSVTVTENSATAGEIVEGTFSATLDDGAGHFIDITDGHFRLKRITP